MSTRNSWSAWTISEPELRQVPNRPIGETELRVYISCPDCDKRLDVAHASAKTNKAHHCGKHMKECASVTSTALVPAQAPSRIYVQKDKVHEKCKEAISALRSEHEHRFTAMERRLGVYDSVIALCMPSIQASLPWRDADNARKSLESGIKIDILSRSTALVPLSAPVPQADVDMSVECDRLRAENAILKRKYEASERDHGAAVEQNKRLRSGDELKTFQKLYKLATSKENVYEKAMLDIDRVLRSTVLPAVSNPTVRESVVEAFVAVVRSQKAEIRELCAREREFRRSL